MKNEIKIKQSVYGTFFALVTTSNRRIYRTAEGSSTAKEAIEATVSGMVEDQVSGDLCFMDYYTKQTAKARTIIGVGSLSCGRVNFLSTLV